jgi:hypothetical protein
MLSGMETRSFKVSQCRFLLSSLEHNHWTGKRGRVAHKLFFYLSVTSVPHHLSLVLQIFIFALLNRTLGIRVLRRGRIIRRESRRLRRSIREEGDGCGGLITQRNGYGIGGMETRKTEDESDGGDD